MTGLELKLQRVRLGFTQYELGQRLRVHPSRLSEMERGQRHVPQDVSARLKALGQEKPKGVEV